MLKQAGRRMWNEHGACYDLDMFQWHRGTSCCSVESTTDLSTGNVSKGGMTDSLLRIGMEETEHAPAQTTMHV